MTENIKNGRTLDSAFTINASNSEIPSAISKILSEIFGEYDGDYFVHSENTIDNKQTKKLYKILYVEDKNGTKCSIFFEII